MKWCARLWAFVKRKCWYILLLAASSIYVWIYRNDIHQLKDFNAQNLIFILWLVLLLLPLFSELEFFGVKLKKEVEKAKAEVKENLNDVKLQLMDLKISNSIANTIQISNTPLPTEKELDELKRQVEELQLKSSFKGNDSLNIDQSVSSQSVYLFKVRLNIETTLSELCEKTGYDGHKSIMQMIRYLNQRELINGTTADLIQQLVKIANRGVHGEIVSNEYIGFVEKAYPQIINQLRDVNEQLQYMVCPKCRFSGYSRYGNVCPQCGSIHDDD